MQRYHLNRVQEQFGILNVASPNTEIYSDEDLELLESVAFQLGSAIKRIYLTDREKKQQN